MVRVGDVGETITVLDKVGSRLQYYPRQVAIAKTFEESAQSRKPTLHVTSVQENVYGGVCMLRDGDYCALDAPLRV